jgi:hypothetical protein
LRASSDAAEARAQLLLDQLSAVEPPRWPLLTEPVSEARSSGEGIEFEQEEEES